MKNIIIYSGLLILISMSSFSQSISSSPYSMYGLGSLYDSDFGSIPSIGSSGIALPSDTMLNNLNPASLGSMPQNHFFFDIGLKGISTTYTNNSTKEGRNNFQFSHLAFGFPVTQKSALSLSLKPYSSSTFKITNLLLPILDSNESYILSASGSGGINDFDLSYGYKINDKLSLGLSTSFLFGVINEDKYYGISNSITTINKNTNYNGTRFVFGSQYALDPSFTVGVKVKSPARINAEKVQSVLTTNSTTTITNESEVETSADDYYMPLEMGLGLSKRFKNNLTLSMDYEKALWNNVNQSESFGTYINQDKFAFGASFKSTKNDSRNYFNLIKYGVGVNYDSGFLEIDSKKITNASLSLGVTLPLNSAFSALNISYSYGQKARVSDDLIKENYHKIALNLSLDGIWFVKRKIE